VKDDCVTANTYKILNFNYSPKNMNRQCNQKFKQKKMTIYKILWFWLDFAWNLTR